MAAYDGKDGLVVEGPGGTGCLLILLGIAFLMGFVTALAVIP